MNPEEADALKLKKRFPTARARWEADKAVDHLPAEAPMTLYTDTWIAAYRQAGGKEKVWKEDE